MTDLRNEVALSLELIVANMKAMAEKTPNVAVDADDFNALLARAKKTFPSLPTIQEMKTVDGGTNLGSIFLKVSILQGAVSSDFSRRNVEAVERENQRTRRQWGEFNRG
jgi:hypothetical protein